MTYTETGTIKKDTLKANPEDIIVEIDDGAEKVVKKTRGEAVAGFGMLQTVLKELESDPKKAKLTGILRHALEAVRATKELNSQQERIVEAMSRVVREIEGKFPYLAAGGTTELAKMHNVGDKVYADQLRVFELAEAKYEVQQKLKKLALGSGVIQIAALIIALFYPGSLELGKLYRRYEDGDPVHAENIMPHKIEPEPESVWKMPGETGDAADDDQTGDNQESQAGGAEQEQHDTGSSSPSLENTSINVDGNEVAIPSITKKGSPSIRVDIEHTTFPEDPNYVQLTSRQAFDIPENLVTQGGPWGDFFRILKAGFDTASYQPDTGMLVVEGEDDQGRHQSISLTESSHTGAGSLSLQTGAASELEQAFIRARLAQDHPTGSDDELRSTAAKITHDNNARLGYEKEMGEYMLQALGMSGANDLKAEVAQQVAALEQSELEKFMNSSEVREAFGKIDAAAQARFDKDFGSATETDQRFLDAREKTGNMLTFEEWQKNLKTDIYNETLQSSDPVVLVGGGHVIPLTEGVRDLCEGDIYFNLKNGVRVEVPRKELLQVRDR